MGVGEPTTRSSGRPPRVAVLWDSLATYLVASLRALTEQGAEVLVVHRRASTIAPFDDGALAAGLDARVWPGDEPDADELGRALEAFDPDAVIVCSWHVGAYRRVARAWRGRTLRIVTIPNQWLARPKQFGGVAIARFVLHPAYDVAFVCDERQATFAAKLGFPPERLLWGTNTCDHALYSSIAQRRGGALPPRCFLFVGRLVPDKAIDVLAAGYRDYHRSADDPWPLLVAGVGPEESLLSQLDGVKMLGFVQPDELPGVVEEAGCLVLPSRFEPWGVVIHEAASAGLPVVCSRQCGASTRLVLDGYNGVVISCKAAALTAALARIHAASDEQRRAMGRASEQLAQQYTPERWAKYLLDRLPVLRDQLGLTAAPWRPDQGIRGRSVDVVAGDHTQDR